MEIFSADKIKTYLDQISGWQLDDNKICKTFTFKNFSHALLFLNAIGYLAEQIGHQPDVAFNSQDVTLSLTSHDVGGITKRDILMAERIEMLVA